MGRRTAIFRPSASDLLFFAAVLVLVVWILTVAREPFLRGMADAKKKPSTGDTATARPERLGF